MLGTGHSFALLTNGPHCFSAWSLLGVLCFPASYMVTWKMSRSRYSCSLGQPTTACCGPMPSTRSTGSRGRLSPPPATKPSCPTPKSWRSLYFQKITCEPCKLSGAPLGMGSCCSTPAPRALLPAPRLCSSGLKELYKYLQQICFILGFQLLCSVPPTRTVSITEL